MSFEITVRRQIGEMDVHLDMQSTARLTALIGPSGSGKTSILNMIAGLLQPNKGRIAIDDMLLFDSEKGVDLPPQARRIGYVFQENRLFPHMRVSANLHYGQRLAPVDQRWVDERDIPNLLGIDHLLDRWPTTLSGGEARRVAIGRALLSCPRILLLDEPLSSIDGARAEEILKSIERIRDELRVPILFVSHDMDEVSRLTDTVFRINEPVKA